MCRQAVPEIGSRDWKGPLADGSESVGRMWMIRASFQMARQRLE